MITTSCAARTWLVGCVTIGCLVAGESRAEWDGFVPTGHFKEQSLEINTDDGIRVVVNAPDAAHFDASRPTTLVIYALPNGNTIEQTAGCQMRGGLDWRHDIQHIAAQTRVLRRELSDRNIVVAYLEADTLSWPAWRAARPDHPARMSGLIDSLATRIPDDDVDLVLSAHSGGGAFLLGMIDAADEIPAAITRIVFLDANYSFDGTQHGGKLLRWLGGDEVRRLVVVAYDDREIMFEGKKVVGPTGGTFRATERMRSRFSEEVEIAESTLGAFTQYKAYEGRLQMLVHPNPENKILHTALVGEMNGYLFALTRGTPAAARWDKLGGPRAYTDWIGPPPVPPFSLPERPVAGESGSEFVKRVASLDGPAREEEIFLALLAGHFPEHLRRLRSVEVTGHGKDGSGHRLQYEVMPDYLAIGGDDDFVRMPMTPQLAQRLADAFGCTLPTSQMVDQIHQAVSVKLAPQPLTEEREAMGTFAEHSRLIDAQRREPMLGELVSGIKKDVVLSNRIGERPHRLALYGWHQLSGEPIQPLTVVHVDTYVDYSHGVRLVKREMVLDGKPIDFAEVAADPDLHPLVSGEGMLEVLRYNANTRAAHP